MIQKIGNYLKQQRQKQGLTLRAVEKKTGISNAYLSQLENNKISEPSPKTLHKLAECYNIPYNRLLKLVGYPISDGIDEGYMGRVAVFRRGSEFDDLTPEEEQKLKEYLEFLRSKRKV